MNPPRINYVHLCAVSIVCLPLIFASHILAPKAYVTSDINLLRNITLPPISGPYNITANILNTQRQRIDIEMDSLVFEDPSVSLAALAPDKGGKPFRSIILTTWRTGSTFLGQILNALPSTYYHYEPLIDVGIVQFRNAPNASKALQHLRKLLTCNYTTMDDYLEYSRPHYYHFFQNSRLWEYCRVYPQVCFNPAFLGPFCKLFPLQTMKVVRLRLSLAETLLTDPELDNARIIYLARDPRGVMQSRKHNKWCRGQPDCEDLALVCSDMEADYAAAQILIEKYPKRLKVIRYEDLSLHPYPMTQSILQFYGLPFDVSVEQFLDSHTRSNVGGIYSTFRDSKKNAFHWMHDLSYDEIERIQDSCGRAMQLWGYRTANRTAFDGSHSFNPLFNYTLSTTTPTSQTSATS